MIRDILVAFQYFVKNGRYLPDDQLLFKPQRCPRCGSPQWMTTIKNSMNWKAAFGAAMVSGPLVGAVVGAAWGEINKVKLCLKCHYFEKLDESQK
ncbi:MAG: hypothetical protein JW755_12350 [Candidatus Aminicenantes bacterium]|nr:hypothetical protein [Candidatus Aminicenantes bacterium]